MSVVRRDTGEAVGGSVRRRRGDQGPSWKGTQGTACHMAARREERPLPHATCG